MIRKKLGTFVELYISQDIEKYEVAKKSPEFIKEVKEVIPFFCYKVIEQKEESIIYFDYFSDAKGKSRYYRFTIMARISNSSDEKRIVLESKRMLSGRGKPLSFEELQKVNNWEILMYHILE